MATGAGAGWSEREASLPPQGPVRVLHFASALGRLLALAYPNSSHTCPSKCRDLQPDLTIGCSCKTPLLLLVQYSKVVPCNYQPCSRTGPPKQSLAIYPFVLPSLCNLFGSLATDERLSNQQSQRELRLCLNFCHHSPRSIAHPCRVHWQQ